MPYADPEKQREYSREYGKRPERLAQVRAYYHARDPKVRLAYKRKWAAENPEKRLAASRRMGDKKRAIVMAAKAVGCQDCGENDLRVIQLHAPNGHLTTKGSIGDGSRMTYAELEAEIKICVPLCANCHLKRHKP